MEAKYHPWRIILGFGIFLVLLLLPPQFGFSLVAWRAFSGIALMIFWWVSEAVPLAATGVVPLILFPVLHVIPMGKLASSYGNPVIFLLLGGFMIGLAITETNLHKRLALHLLKFTGGRPDRVVLGFMGCAAFISMWISNTATAAMLLPIALSVIALEEKYGCEQKNFATALLLGIAYSASVGGLGTLIGTAPNAFLAAHLQQIYHIHLYFSDWILIALPIEVIGVLLIFILLTKVVFRFPVVKDQANKQLAYFKQSLVALGPLTSAERNVMVIFVCTAGLWFSRRWLNGYFPFLTDGAIAMLGGLSLFLVPGVKNRSILNQSSFAKLPWDILLLFGGGLCIANVIAQTGIDGVLISHLTLLKGVPSFLLVLIITTAMIFLTEVMSNTATIATFLPVLSKLAISFHMPLLRLLVPATLAVSCAFMLPIATPPNAIVYSSQKIKLTDMVRAGLIINLCFIALITFGVRSGI